MATPVDNAQESQQLRRLLHEKIDQLPPAHLASFGQTLQEWELGLLRRQLDADLDDDRAAGKLAPEKVQEAVALHRARRPYRQ